MPKSHQPRHTRADRPGDTAGRGSGPARGSSRVSRGSAAFRSAGRSLLPEAARSVGPDVDLVHIADDAGLDPFVGEPSPLGRRAPGCPSEWRHRSDARPWSTLGIRAACGSAASGSRRACRPDRRHGGDGVDVIGRADRHRIDVAASLSSMIRKSLYRRALGISLERARASFVVDVAEGDDSRRFSCGWRCHLLPCRQRQCPRD